MSKDIQEILRSLREFEDTLESRLLERRLHLAEIVIRTLRRKGWSQRDLADAASMRESFISRVLHSNANCTLGTADRLFYALGIDVPFNFNEVVTVDATMTEVGAADVVWKLHNAAGEIQILNREETGDASSISTSEGSTRKESWQVQQANTGA